MKFLKKIVRLISVVMLIAVAFWVGTVATDKARLTDGVIRLHIVADSDSKEDQDLKLMVRDAILQELDGVIDEFPDMESAKAHLAEQLPKLEQIANQTLQKAGSDCAAVVTLAKEAFPTREYDSFKLPAGVYEAIRVTIGSGEGKNWWCVVFPQLCVSASGEEFTDAAVGAGFSDDLTGALQGKQEHQVRFFVLDCFGWIENWLFGK